MRTVGLGTRGRSTEGPLAPKGARSLGVQADRELAALGLPGLGELSAHS